MRIIIKCDSIFDFKLNVWSFLYQIYIDWTNNVEEHHYYTWKGRFYATVAMQTNTVSCDYT